MKKLIIGLVLVLCFSAAGVYAEDCSPFWHKEYVYTCVKVHPNFYVAQDQAWACAEDHCNPPENCYCVYESSVKTVTCGSLTCYQYTVVVYNCCWYGN